MSLLGVALVAAVAGRIYLERTAPRSAEETASLSDEEARLFAMVNATRVHDGLKPLAFSPKLAVVARGHSYDMAIRSYLAHNTPEGATPADRVRGVGIRYAQLGENIYMDTGGLEGLPERAIKGWLASPRHRDNLMAGNFAQSGIGIARSADGKAYVTQDFMREE